MKCLPESYFCHLELHIHDRKPLNFSLIRKCQKDSRIYINSYEYSAGYKKCLNLYVVLILAATRNKHLPSRRSALSHQTSHLTSTPGNNISLHPLCWYSSKYACLSYCEFSPTKAGFESQTKIFGMHLGIYPFFSGRGGGASFRWRLYVACTVTKDAHF